MKKQPNQIFREARQRVGASQAFISKATGIDRSKLSLFENGYASLRNDEKKAVAKSLCLSIKECFGGSDEE